MSRFRVSLVRLDRSAPLMPVVVLAVSEADALRKAIAQIKRFAPASKWRVGAIARQPEGVAA